MEKVDSKIKKRTKLEIEKERLAIEEGLKTINTIREARAFLKAHWWDGLSCPCCKQFVKLYKRQIYASLAKGLITLYKINHDGKTWVHVPSEFNKRSMSDSMGDFAKAKAWGLVDEKANEDDPEKTNSGYWRINQKGIDYIFNKITIPKYIVFYNQKAYLKMKVPGKNPEVNIIDALGKKFSYIDLMN
jgi:hypothetical protein